MRGGEKMIGFIRPRFVRRHEPWARVCVRCHWQKRTSTKPIRRIANFRPCHRGTARKNPSGFFQSQVRTVMNRNVGSTGVRYVHVDRFAILYRNARDSAGWKPNRKKKPHRGLPAPAAVGKGRQFLRCTLPYPVQEGFRGAPPLTPGIPSARPSSCSEKSCQRCHLGGLRSGESPQDRLRRRVAPPRVRKVNPRRRSQRKADRAKARKRQGTPGRSVRRDHRPQLRLTMLGVILSRYRNGCDAGHMGGRGQAGGLGKRHARTKIGSHCPASAGKKGNSEPVHRGTKSEVFGHWRNSAPLAVRCSIQEAHLGKYIRGAR